MSSPLKRRLASSPPLDVRWLPTANQLVRHLPKRRHIASFANEKPLLRPSLLTHRGRDSGIFSSSDTETDATSEDELGTALSDVESEVRGAERNEASPVDGDDEEIDIVLMASSAPWSPVAHAWPEEKGKGVDPREHGERSRKRRRVETPDANSDGEGDDEREAELMLVDMTKSKKTLLGPGSGKRTLHRPHPLFIARRPVASTKSIVEITRFMDDLAAASSCEIALEVEMESDEDSKLVSASLPVEASPSPPCPQVEMELRVVPRTVFRRPQHREYPVRLPGQHTTANLHRQSPTSLLPRREKHRRAPHTHSSHLETILFTSAGCQIGQAWLSVLHSRKEVQVKRRDFMTAHNTLNENGPWVDKIGKWDMHDWVVAASKPWWLKPIQPEEEHEVEGLLPAADVDGDVDSSFVDAFLEDEPVVASPRKRIERTESWSGAEASTRWARRTELRLREEVRPHLDRLRERRVSRVQAAERARLQRAEAAHRRIQAERLRREEEERLAAERELTRIALDPPSPDSIRRDAPAPPSRESSGSPSLSEPPEYEFPFYPVVIPRPAHLRPRPANRTRATGASTPPRYLRDLHYGSRSPSPPPPYNASTDRHTIFIEDDPEEEAMLSRIRPSGRFGSPNPVQSIVGAFPEPQPSLLAPIPVRIPGRSAWDAALELEEGEEDIVEDAFEEEVARDVVEQVPVLGQIGRLLGRVWRW